MNEAIENFDEIMVSFGSTAPSAWSAYNGASYPVSWQTEAGTVYGGTLDVTTGVLTVDRKKIHFEGNGDAWYISVGAGSGCNRATIVLSGAKTGAYTQIVSDIFRYEQASSPPLFAGAVNNNAVLLLGVPTSITDRAEMNAWAAENPFDIVYFLDTPQTYQLTPTQVQLLLGENYVWSDAGDTTLTYYGTEPEEVDALNLLLGGGYRNLHGPDDVSDAEALDIILNGGNDR